MNFLSQKLVAFKDAFKVTHYSEESPSLEDHKNGIFEFLSQENDTDFNTVDSSGWCPIQRAICINNPTITKRLLQLWNNVDLNVPNCGKRTPLTYAISQKNVKITEILINFGADLNKEDSLYWTPLMKAKSTNLKPFNKKWG